MKIKFLGHAAFLIEGGGKKIITDPYKPNAFDSLKYQPIDETADIVLVSHDHDDHNYSSGIKGNPLIIKGGEREIAGVKIRGIPTYHDKSKGKERGENTIFVVETEGINLAHLGDLGEIPSQEVRDKIGEVDILLLPVGGYFTISPEEATMVVNQIKPKIIIPMHYKTKACLFPIAEIEEFLKGKRDVKFLEKSEVTVDYTLFQSLPKGGEIWVLKPERA